MMKVAYVVEKPERSPSNLAIMPIYIFEPEIFNVIREIGPGVGGEIQLTDTIQKLIEMQKPVRVIKLGEMKLDWMLEHLKPAGKPFPHHTGMLKGL